MTKKEAIIFIVIILVFTVGFYYFMRNRYAAESTAKAEPKEAISSSFSSAIRILETWNLPEELMEISANVLLDENRMACVQDNEGIIYIYNLENKAIENKIHFAEKGDFEGLAIVNNTYFVLRADGFLYEVMPNNQTAPSVKTYDLPLSIENDTESMFYDSTHHRLLIGVKEKDPGGGSQKGVYSFNLDTKQMNTPAVFYISDSEKNNETENDEKKEKKKHKKDMGNDGGKKSKKDKKDNSRIKPSEIAIHPKTGDIYILNGPESELLIAMPSGKIKATIALDKNIFPQPEGMCFAANSDFYISSEGGKKGQGVIARVEL
jgi:hypothetical protein